MSNRTEKMQRPALPSPFSPLLPPRGLQRETEHECNESVSSAIGARSPLAKDVVPLESKGQFPTFSQPVPRKGIKKYAIRAKESQRDARH